MKNYYDFNNLNYDEESINYFINISSNILLNILNDEFNNIQCYINYYAELLNNLFNGNDYNEHFYTLKSLNESLNDIKIILNILKERDFDE